jgi:N-acetylmuramoyl-L-alanine amidase
MKRHNWLKKHTLGLAAALLMTAGMSQIALAGDSVYVNTSSLRYRTSAQIKDNNIAGFNEPAELDEADKIVLNEDELSEE